MSDLDDEELEATRRLNRVSKKSDIEILEDLKKYISFANKQCNFSNDADYKWHKELAGMIENLIQENKELKEYKKIAELTKISCCTAQNCEALNNAIKNGLENEKLIQENKKLKEKFDVIQRKIYRLEEDNIELLKPRGKDQLNYKYIECPKVEAEWYKSESYIKDNYIPKSKIKEIIYPTPENPIPFEVQTSEMYKRLEKLVEGE